MIYYDERQLRRLKRKRQAAKLLDILIDYKQRRRSDLFNVPLPRGSGEKDGRDLLDNLDQEYNELKYNEDHGKILYFLLRVAEYCLRDKNLKLNELYDAIRNHLRILEPFTIFEGELVQSALTNCRNVVKEKLVKKITSEERKTQKSLMHSLRNLIKDKNNKGYKYDFHLNNNRVTSNNFNRVRSENEKAFFSKVESYKGNEDGLVDIYIKMLLASQYKPKHNYGQLDHFPPRLFLRYLNINLETVDFQGAERINAISFSIDGREHSKISFQYKQMRDKLLHSLGITNFGNGIFEQLLLKEIKKKSNLDNALKLLQRENPEDHHNESFHKHLKITIPHKKPNEQLYNDLSNYENGRQTVYELLPDLDTNDSVAAVQSLLKQSIDLKEHFFSGFVQGFNKKSNGDSKPKTIEAGVSANYEKQKTVFKINNDDGLNDAISKSHKLLVLFYKESIVPAVKSRIRFIDSKREISYEETFKTTLSELNRVFTNEACNLALYSISDGKSCLEHYLKNYNHGFALYEKCKMVFADELNAWALSRLNDKDRLINYFKKQVVFPPMFNEEDQQQIEALKCKLNFTYHVLFGGLMDGGLKNIKEFTKNYFNTKNDKNLPKEMQEAYNQGSKMRMVAVKEGIMEGATLMNLSYGVESLNDLLDAYKRLSEMPISNEAERLSEMPISNEAARKMKQKVKKIRDSVLAFWNISPSDLNFYLVNPDLGVEDTDIAVQKLKAVLSGEDDYVKKTSKWKSILFKLGVKVGHDTAEKHDKRPIRQTRTVEIPTPSKPWLPPSLRKSYKPDDNKQAKPLVVNKPDKLYGSHKGNGGNNGGQDGTPWRSNVHSKKYSSYESDYKSESSILKRNNERHTTAGHNKPYGSQKGNGGNNVGQGGTPWRRNVFDHSRKYPRNESDYKSESSFSKWINKRNTTASKRGRKSNEKPDESKRKSRKRRASDVCGSSAKKSKVEALERKIAEYERKIRRLEEMMGAE